MRHTFLALSSLCCFGTGLATAESALKTTNIELPRSAAIFPGGAKADAVNNNCLTCHSSEMVLMQPALPKQEWAKEVAKMRKVYGAPISDEDATKAVDYLAALKPAN